MMLGRIVVPSVFRDSSDGRSSLVSRYTSEIGAVTSNRPRAMACTKSADLSASSTSNRMRRHFS
jgi:hypothetical protein